MSWSWFYNKNIWDQNFPLRWNSTNQISPFLASLTDLFLCSVKIYADWYWKSGINLTTLYSAWHYLDQHELTSEMCFVCLTRASHLLEAPPPKKNEGSTLSKFAKQSPNQKLNEQSWELRKELTPSWSCRPFIGPDRLDLLEEILLLSSSHNFTKSKMLQKGLLFISLLWCSKAMRNAGFCD